MDKRNLLKLAQEKGWDDMLDSLPCKTEKGGDPCESQKNAVKVACKNDNPLHVGTACSNALEALADCMDANY